MPLFGAFSGYFPIERSVRMDVDDTKPISFAICEAVRKGEQVLVLGDVPLPDILYRWHLGPLKIPFARLKMLSDSHNRMPMDSRFCFEQVWFGRYACQLKTYDQSRAALLDIREQLRLRQITKAECRQILNIFWYHDDPPPDSLVEEYTYLAKVLNLRFVVCGPEVDDESDEHYDTWYTPEMLHAGA